MILNLNLNVELLWWWFLRCSWPYGLMKVSVKWRELMWGSVFMFIHFKKDKIMSKDKVLYRIWGRLFIRLSFQFYLLCWRILYCSLIICMRELLLIKISIGIGSKIPRLLYGHHFYNKFYLELVFIELHSRKYQFFIWLLCFRLVIHLFIVYNSTFS